MDILDSQIEELSSAEIIRDRFHFLFIFALMGFVIYQIYITDDYHYYLPNDSQLIKYLPDLFITPSILFTRIGALYVLLFISLYFTSLTALFEFDKIEIKGNLKYLYILLTATLPLFLSNLILVSTYQIHLIESEIISSDSLNTNYFLFSILVCIWLFCQLLLLFYHLKHKFE